MSKLVDMPKNILHAFFTGQNASPFDINMAVDAGYDLIVPYSGIGTDDVTALVQDCIYSRPPKYFNHSGIFIGGRDVNQAAEMLTAATAAMEKPFDASVFADPNGSYTTSAALVAMVEHHLQAAGGGLSGSKVVIFGGGPVGLCVAVLVAQKGAMPVIARLTPGSEDKRSAMDKFMARYDVVAEHCDAQTDDGKIAALLDAGVIVSAAKAGVEVLSADILKQGCNAKVAADVNAVPPAGIAGVGIMDNGVAMDTVEGCAGIGALAIGNIKYKTQQGLLQQMLQSDAALVLDFPKAYALAVDLVSNG